jgi:hypothetical protein
LREADLVERQGRDVAGRVMTADSNESRPRWHDVTVRRVRRDTVVGYQKLLRRLEHIRKVSKELPTTEHGAQGVALLALSEFLAANVRSGNGPAPVIPVWLNKMASSLTDPAGEGLSSNDWRKIAIIAVGMKALTIGGVKREEAAKQAHRAVRTLGNIDVRILLHRYDEFQKGRVKNREGAWVFGTESDKLSDAIERDGFEAVAKRYFELADLADGA